MHVMHETLKKMLPKLPSGLAVELTSAINASSERELGQLSRYPLLYPVLQTLPPPRSCEHQLTWILYQLA